MTSQSSPCGLSLTKHGSSREWSLSLMKNCRAIATENQRLRSELELSSVRPDNSPMTNWTETNKGVVALYAELDDKAAELREASELKSRFLSYMSHEFRTPLGSIRSIARILLDEFDGPLTSEQENKSHSSANRRRTERNGQ